MKGWTVLVAIILAADPASGQTAVPPLAERYDFSNPVARFELPGRLDEVSGLAFAPDGRLFAHNDERGIIYVIDPSTGTVDQGFGLGPDTIRGDFEGIAIVEDRFFVVASTGVLAEFRSAPVGQVVPVRTTDTRLGSTCEVEGLAYHTGTESLFFACKTTVPLGSALHIHRIPLDPSAPQPTEIRVPRTSLVALGLEEDLRPSGLDADPQAGTLVFVAANARALVEIDLAGRVRSAAQLARALHRQPEGVAFGPDGRLYIADEASGEDATLTVYGLRSPQETR